MHGIYSQNLGIVKNFLLGKLSDPEKFKFNINFENLKTLQEKIDILKDNEELPELIANETINAELLHKNSKYKVSLKLAGGEMDHVSSNKWSFRCKIRGGKSILGMNEFNLMHPQTRLYISSWVCNELYKKNDFVNIKYEYVDVTINGESKGVYILEEWFDKPMIERNGNRAGIIFRPVSNNRLKIFKEKSIMSDEQLSNQLSYLNNSYIGLMDGKIKPRLFFDYEKFSKHFAFVDLLNGGHSLFRQNLIWYFNPITKLVEPIAREWSSRAFTKIESITYDIKDDIFINKLFADEEFLSLYLSDLKDVSTPSFVIDFFDEIKPQKDSLLNIIYKDYPYFDYSKEYLINNQKYIRNRLESLGKNIETTLIINDNNKKILSLKNEGDIPIRLHSIIVDGIEKKFNILKILLI